MKLHGAGAADGLLLSVGKQLVISVSLNAFTFKYANTAIQPRPISKNCRVRSLHRQRDSFRAQHDLVTRQQWKVVHDTGGGYDFIGRIAVEVQTG